MRGISFVEAITLQPKWAECVRMCVYARLCVCVCACSYKFLVDATGVTNMDDLPVVVDEPDCDGILTNL